MELRQPQHGTAGMSVSGQVLALYGGMALAAVLISAGRHDVDIYRLAEVSTPTRLLYSPFVGVAVGLLVVGLSRLATARYRWARRLHRNFRDLLGPRTGREILILAAASSIGEELLFRGALLPWLGTDFGKGAVRWYSLGFISLQPSEFLKPAFAMVAAWLTVAPDGTWLRGATEAAVAVCCAEGATRLFGRAAGTNEATTA